MDIGRVVVGRTKLCSRTLEMDTSCRSDEEGGMTGIVDQGGVGGPVTDVANRDAG